MSAERFAIIDLAAHYMRGLDRLDGALLEAQFWPDASCEYGVFSGSPADFAAFCMTMLKEHQRNHHMLGQHLIDFVSEDEAFGEVYYQAYHRVFDDSDSPRDLFIAGLYVDRYARRDGVWKIAYRSELVDGCVTIPLLTAWSRSRPSSWVSANPPTRSTTAKRCGEPPRPHRPRRPRARRKRGSAAASDARRIPQPLTCARACRKAGPCRFT